jgi:predicted aconitase with swiveling domain
MALKLKGCGVIPGRSEGEILATDHPISFWGDVDPHSARVNNRRHPLFGKSIAGRVLVFPVGKGSSTGSLMMLELIRIGKAPAAIINIRTEPILATGPIVAKHFYGKSIPILSLDPQSFEQLKTGQHATIDTGEGYVIIDE